MPSHALQRHLWRGLLLASLLGLSACGDDSRWPFSAGETSTDATPPDTADASPDYWPTEDWQTGSEDEHGFTAGAFDTLAADAATALPYHTSLMVIRDGWIVHESYNSPGDTPIDANYKHHVWSITKSVTSMAVGRAHTLGGLTVPDGIDKANALDITTEDIFPDGIMSSMAADDARRHISLRHVLQMRSGLAWNEPAWLMNQTAMKDPLLRLLLGTLPADCPLDSGIVACAILRQDLAYTPGTVWNYNTYDSYLVSTFFTLITGQSLNQYAVTNLFAPLGISTTTSDWINLPAPTTFGGGLLNIRTRDLGRLGMLMLYDGKWENEQLIAPDWIALSTTPQGNGLIATFDENGDPGTPLPLNLEYGLQWWTTTGVMSGDRALTARGLGGQFMQIHKDKELIIIITCDEGSYQETLPYRSSQIEAFLKNRVVGALTD